MQHQSLLQLLAGNEQFKKVSDGLNYHLQHQAVFGLVGSQKHFWWATLAGWQENLQFLIITMDDLSARRIVDDLSTFCGEENVLFFPGQEFLPYQIYARSREISGQRIGVLSNLIRKKPRIVVTTGEAFCQKLMPVQVFRRYLLDLQVGQQLTMETLNTRLTGLGYERVDLVEAPGQYAVRGGLVDVFPLNTSQPLRVDFFDDEIETLRVFDIETQLSGEKLQETIIAPAWETLVGEKELDRALPLLNQEWQATVNRLEKLKKTSAIQALNEKVKKQLEELEQGIINESWERWQPFFYEKQSVLTEYFQVTPVLILDEPHQVLEKIHRFEKERAETFMDLLEAGEVLPGQSNLYWETEEVRKIISRGKVLAFSSLPQSLDVIRPQNLVNIQSKTAPLFLGKVKMLKEELLRWKKLHYSVVFMVSTRERGEHLRELLWENHLEGVWEQDLRESLYPGQVRIIPGNWHQGFEMPSLKLVLLTEQEVFGQRQRRRSKPAFKEGAKIFSFADLKEDDYVVHVHYGIGRYLGVQRLEVGGVCKDYLQIQYHGADRLYVPTDQIDLIQKYIGAEGHVPRLNKLGGTEWSRVKHRVKASVQDMAEGLIKLYAARETARGHVFSLDTPWQQEFEDLFPYKETPDQLQAIIDVKKDMEGPKPMERLLCGDVGYGKTEVALRAAFKAVMDSKQVAVLVPTTVLAQQHYNTFQERFAPFPVKIGLLSRFRTPKEQSQVIKGLKNGSVDLVIGTHRLLSADVSFKNLGLVVIDEEQRFGVAHKERLKQIRQNVDVLTLTATPIPRTLHMALSGVRDMSTIETPPEDRYPVQTYVVEYHPDLVRDAIRRELGRGGQVYFIHNRIQDLERILAHVQELVPEARVALAHGQMKENELEDVMLAFIEGDFDVLVCTTIIENGLDIANVNTLIVDEADQLGLAQLYQLRGRVGRTNRLAYAYFTYRPQKVINTLAQRRLSAIREFTEFGSGFRIAMRDLEIRGAGNLLGPEQHGQILAVGFDLYCKLLADAVEEARGRLPESQEKPVSPLIELNVDAYLPDNFISQSGLKMEMYRRLSLAQNLEEVEACYEEILDRFGTPPSPVQNLIRIACLRVQAMSLGVKRLAQTAREVEIETLASFPLKGEKLIRLAQDFPRKLSFSTAGGLMIKARIDSFSQEELLAFLESVFKRMKSLAFEDN
ncbi:MAG TPA: transcription-repair coupling factor [Clostridia bacterium]|nr:transcription-repair coupling factor [Clostridia bacterium]